MITFDKVSKVYPDGTVAVDKLTITAPEREDHHAGRAVGLREDDLDADDQPPDRADVGHDRTRRRRHPDPRPGRIAPTESATSSRTPACSPTARSSTTSPPCRACSAAARRKPVRRQWNSSSVSGWTPSSPNGIRGSCPAVSSSGSGWRVRWRPIRPSCLMDEPFSAVDPIVRNQLQDEFLRLQADISKTIVMVTHDIDEALKLGDQVVVLRAGRDAGPGRHARRAAGRAERRVRRRLRRVGTRLPGARASTPPTACSSSPRSRLSRWDSRFRRFRRHTDAGSWWSTPTSAPIGWVDTESVRGDCVTRQRRQPQRHVCVAATTRCAIC